MSEDSSSPKRSRMDFDDNGKDEHFDKLFKNRDFDDPVSLTQAKRKRVDLDDDDLKDSEDGKSKILNIEAARREQTFVMRLANKEQELQECMNQIQEMKQAQTQNTAQLRSMLLDPAINLVFQRMAREMDEHKEKLKVKQNELSAWKFTADSQTGLRLMAKCRMLHQENDELGKMISSGRTARLEGEISLHKALVGEMKKNQKELDEFVGELEEDVEGMQGMIFLLQQQLKEARDLISHLQQENEQLRTLQPLANPEPGGDSDTVTLRSSYEPSSSAVEQQSSIDSTQTLKSSTVIPDCSLLGSSTDSNIRDDDDLPQKACRDAAAAVLTDITAVSAKHLSSAQNSEILTTDPFALKTTPDSGLQTQEEEDISMDATESPLTLSRDYSSAQQENTQQPSSSLCGLGEVSKHITSHPKKDGTASNSSPTNPVRTSGATQDLSVATPSDSMEKELRTTRLSPPPNNNCDALVASNNNLERTVTNESVDEGLTNSSTHNGASSLTERCNSPNDDTLRTTHTHLSSTESFSVTKAESDVKVTPDQEVSSDVKKSLLHPALELNLENNKGDGLTDCSPTRCLVNGSSSDLLEKE